jgi:type IV pilus assembly protein PilC
VLQAAQGHIKSGKPLSEFLSGYKRLFPPLIVSVVKIGEETGELDKVMEETAVFFESEVDQTMKNLTSILEPVLMVIIGLAVGALAISIISPIYNLVSVI